MANLQEFSTEVWSDIKGFEGCYRVSSLGRVMSISRNITGKDGVTKPIKERVLKNKKKKSGYLFVSLCKDGKINYHHVHRLVAAAFIPICIERNQVNHIDGVKSNNNVSNLEWMTHTENNIHAISTGLKVYNKSDYKRSSKHYKSKHVNQYDLNGNLLKRWDCISDAARHLNCHNNGISRVIHNKRGGKTCMGYKWSF